MLSVCFESFPQEQNFTVVLQDSIAHIRVWQLYLRFCKQQKYLANRLS